MILQLFVYLNVLDFVSTAIAFKFGYAEASPYIRRLAAELTPMGALLISKLLAAFIVTVCYLLKRPGVIQKINYGYAALVLWNLGVLLCTHPAVKHCQPLSAK